MRTITTYSKRAPFYNAITAVVALNFPRKAKKGRPDIKAAPCSLISPNGVRASLRHSEDHIAHVVRGANAAIVVHLIILTFIRAHVAAARVLLVGTRFAALIRLQQMTLAIGAATRIARVSRRTAREQRDSLCRSAVVP
jgi:hypothetical protein